MPSPDLIIAPFSQAAWREAITGNALSGLSLLQTWAYGEAKAAEGPWQVERALFKEGNAVVGAVQLLLRPLPFIKGGLAWVSRGPLWLDDDAGPDRLKEILAALKEHYAVRGKNYLRIAPALDELAYDNEVFRRAGFPPTAALGWSSARLDLAPDLEALRKNLKQKWRNGLNKAIKLEPEVILGDDPALFSEVIAGYRDFLKARGFTTSVTPALLENLYRFQGGGGPEEKLFSLMATKDGALLGGVIMARYGTTWEYLAGFNTDAGQKANTGQLLLWRAIEEMKSRGAAHFDLGGMDSELTPPGIYRFKEGVGGERYRLAPELETAGGGLRARLVRRRVNKARAGG